VDVGTEGGDHFLDNEQWTIAQQNALQRLEEKVRLLSSQISDTLFSREDLESPPSSGQ